MQVRSQSSRTPKRRRGILMAWTIWLTLAAGLIAGGLFNLLSRTGQQAEARRSAEAAAIAAGHAYLSDDLLRTRQESFEHDGRATRCRQAAIDMSQAYSRQSRVPVVTESDVRLSMPDAATALQSNHCLVPNRIDVLIASAQAGFDLPLFFSGLVGAQRAKVQVGASVAIEHTPVAFRPGTDVPVPMLPFAILDDKAVSTVEGQAPRSGYWTSCIESGKGKDAWSWDPSVQQFAAGPDGIPEITVTINCDGTSGEDAFIPLAFAATHRGVSTTQCIEWINDGLKSADLNSLGLQELAYPSTHPVMMVGSQQLASVASALQSRCGHPLLVSLCTRSDASSATNVKLTRPVAVRIVRVATSTGGHTRVTLQPCVLTTATAVTATTPTVAANRYIYSVRLSN